MSDQWDGTEVIDLDALVKPVGKVKVFGETYPVLPANGRAADLLQQITQRQAAGQVGGLNYMEIAREIVSDCVPSLSAEFRTKLTVDQLSAIIGLATRQIDTVRELIAATEKNGNGAVTIQADAKRSPAPKSTVRSGRAS